MSNDLLDKERQFRKINLEVQSKTHDVIKEINSITHASNELFNNTKQLHINVTVNNAKATYPRNKASNEQLQKSSLEITKILSTENIDNTESSSRKQNNLGNEAIIKLLKDKIDMLNNNLQMVKVEYNKKCEYSKELEVKTKQLGETQGKLHNQIKSLNNTIVNLESTNDDMLSKYQGLSNENIALKKDLHNLRMELKLSHKQLSNSDIRLNRSLEMNEKLKNLLKSSQLEEKELRSQIKKILEDKRLVIKNLEKQQLELVQAFKKQILLIDNLKRQNICLMASGQIYLTGENFMKLLNWKP